MKILLTSDWSIGNINGVVVSIMNLYNELKKDGHDVRILTLSKKDESYVDGDFYFVRSFGIKFYPDLRATFAINSRILKKLIEWKPDIVHSQCEFFTYYFAYKIAIESSAPLIHTYHTLYEYYTKYVIPSETVGRLIVQNYMRVRLRDCDAIIAPTNKVKKSLENAKVYGKIKVIPTGIDLDKYNKNLPSEELEDLRKSFNIDKNKKIILSLGRVAREKKYRSFIKIY
ncbi:glycosyltransferase [Citroniella saccharovorans]|uniref:Glycosyltransferase n=1 Tax=Citroniella saccharovorans TaxID=2053367 RepID=A0AAW9MZZ2_9FIRM|nr:glycosyltransferase [Citroniella saccharovorans]MEB3429965.1 glycosyltransferase [Citroniella saccharovorans]